MAGAGQKRIQGWGQALQLALPSESQWEAACRAGRLPLLKRSTSALSLRRHAGCELGPLRRQLHLRQGPARVNTKQRPVPIGFFGLVNRWGLAELHGQQLSGALTRWHRDPVAGSIGDGSPVEDPDPELAEGNQEQAYRLLRGGSWFDDPRTRPRRLPGQLPPGHCRHLRWRPSRAVLLPPGSLLGP